MQCMTPPKMAQYLWGASMLRAPLGVGEDAEMASSALATGGWQDGCRVQRCRDATDRLAIREE